MILSAVTLGSAALLVLVDFFIKKWAVAVLQPVTQIDIIPDVLSLYYHQNYGAAWGILQGRLGFLLLVTAIVLGALVVGVLLQKFKGKLVLTSMALIIGGGVGNLVDRFFNPGGFVVDYIYFEPINFPIFNFADCCVVVGTFLHAYYIIFLEGKEKSVLQTEPQSKNREEEA